MNLRQPSGLVRVAWILGVVPTLGVGHGSSCAQATAEQTRAALAVWDTGKPSAEPLAPEAVDQKNSWKPIAIGATARDFDGDAAITNGRLLAVARKQGTGVELYSLGSGKPVFRARLLLVPGAGIDRVALRENSRAAVGLEVASKAGAARFRLKKSDSFVEVQGPSAEAALRVECPSRFAVLPDFFADDILFDARKVPLDKVELPSENFLLHFTGKQDAIVMDVFENRAQDVRVDFTRKDGLTDSWDMLLPDQDGSGFIKPSWLAQDGKIRAATRTATGAVDRDAYKPGGPASDRLGPDRLRWTTVLGQVPYPCWSDRQRKAFVQPLEHKRLTFDGPVLIYALTRLAETPVDAYTTVDIVRNTLGVGPCQHLLDVEGQKQEHVGRATCHVRTLLNEIYGSGQQKAKRTEIENYLGDALDFVTHIRHRILAYVAFEKELQKYLAEQRAAHPEFKEALDALEVLAGEIDARLEPRMQAILQHKTLKEIAARVVKQRTEPTPPALAAQLNRDFIAKGLLDYNGSDWQDKLKKEYTDPLTALGGQQDEMVGECRWVVKALRQQAGILMATHPNMAPIAAEVRTRTQKMLRGGAAYEGARH